MMNCKSANLILSTFVAAVLVQGTIGNSFAQSKDPTPTALMAETRTAAVLDRAIEVYGGKEFLDSINNVEIELSGQWWAEGRSWNSSARRPFAIKRQAAFQREEGNYRYSGVNSDEDFAGNLMSAGSVWANTVTKDSVHLVFPLLKMATSGFALPGITTAAEALSPHLIVSELISSRAKLTWIGEESFDGRVYDLIAYPQGISGNTVFAFDKETGVLAGMQRVLAGGGRPDRVLRIRFGGYHEEGGVLVPSTRTFVDGDQITQENRYETYDLDAKLDPAVFQVPADFDVYVNESDFNTKPRELAPGVFWIANGVNSLFVEFDDYVVVLNTPSRQPAAYIAAIRKQVGDKPIRFAVPMDHHSSNSGGLRAYVAAGIPIIATSGNRDYFTRLATVHSKLLPDDLAKNPKPPKFEIVDDRRVFDDGNMRLELINVGPISHAQDIYVGYLPKQGILFTVDLLNLNPESLPMKVPDEFQPLLHENMEALESAGATTAKIIAPGNGSRLLTWADVEKVAHGETTD